MRAERSRRDAAIAEAVLGVMLSHYRLDRPANIGPWLSHSSPVPAFNLRQPDELAKAAATLRSLTGCIMFRVDVDDVGGSVHPLVRELRAVSNVLQLGEAIRHPLEQDDRDRERRLSEVMTVRAVPSAGVALSNRRLPFHFDGLGTAGSVRFIAMCLDRPPIAGGEHSYVNVLAHGIRLADQNWQAFVDATSLNALTITRTAGAQSISVSGPLFYVDESGFPAVHFRSGGGEYRVEPGERVATWFDEFVTDLESSAMRCRLRPGDCVVVDNMAVAHAREAYVDRPDAPRRLARKWYAIAPDRTPERLTASLRLSHDLYPTVAGNSNSGAELVSTNRAAFRSGRRR